MTTIETLCPICGEYNHVKVHMEDYKDYVLNGKHAQDAFPYLYPSERELLISGICPKCWADLFCDEEDDEEECFEPGRPVIDMFALNP